MRLLLESFCTILYLVHPILRVIDLKKYCKKEENRCYFVYLGSLKTTNISSTLFCIQLYMIESGVVKSYAVLSV